MLQLAVIVAVAGAGVTAIPPNSTDPGESNVESHEVPAPAPPVGAAVPQPDVATGSTEFERQLAELSFTAFLSTDVGVEAVDFACSEPSSLDEGTAITCFSLLDQDRLLVATTAVSGGSGVYDFSIVDTVGVPDATAIPATGPIFDDPDGAVLAHGEAIDATAGAFIEQYLTDPRIADISTYDFDPDSLELTLDLTLAPGAAFSPEDVAWANTEAIAAFHWADGQPFRASGASARPSFVMAVDGDVFVSDHDLMTAVADGRVQREAWLAAVERPQP